MQKLLTISIPEGLAFESLRLSRDPITGDLSFDWAPVKSICAASNIDPEIFRLGDEDNIATLITAWYQSHRSNGGATDLVAEQIIAEVHAEDDFGLARVQRGPGTKQ